MTSLIKFRFLLGLTFLVVLFFLLWQAVVPTGQISYSTEFQKKNDFLSPLSPKTRVKDDNKVIGNPIYFTLRTPRRFETAELEITYKNDYFKIVEAGLLVDGELWRYKNYPLENKILDELKTDWYSVYEPESNNLLLQKEKQYQAIEEFLAHLPSQEKIAVYNYNLEQDFIIPDYEATPDKQELKTDLRGSYQFYTYIKEEKLDFKFLLQDINQNDDSDKIDIHLYFKDVLIDSRHLSDDGITEATGEVTKPREISLEVPDLPEGVYKIEVRVNDDILTKEIKTSQQKISFLNQLRLAFTNENEQKLYTTGQELSAKITDPKHLQAVEVKSDYETSSLLIEETYTRFSTKLNNCQPCQINLTSGGIALFSNGVFSFDSASLLDPSIAKVDSNFYKVSEGIEYIIANYSSPKRQGDWQVATVEIDLTQGYTEANKYSFMISVPELRAEEAKENYLEIKGVKVKLKGKTLWEKILRQ